MNSKFELTFGVTVKLKKGNKIFFLELECLLHCLYLLFEFVTSKKFTGYSTNF